MSEDENGWDVESRGRPRATRLDDYQMDSCSIDELVAFLRDYPNVSNVFVVRRLVKRVDELESIESDFQTMEQRADAEVAECVTREIALKKRVAELEGSGPTCSLSTRRFGKDLKITCADGVWLADKYEQRVAELEGRHQLAPMAVACGLPPDATVDELYDRMSLLKNARKSSVAFVHRQKIYGKHEQDRDDAAEWLDKYGVID